MKKIVSILICVCMTASILLFSEPIAEAYSIPSENAFLQRINELKSKYPHGSTWSGTYYEGGVARAWQCYGYAWQIAYEIFGSSQYTNNGGWQKSYTMGTLCAGDWVRIYTNGEPNNHSIFITKVSGNNIYYTDGNANGKNGVRWDQYYSVAQLQQKFTYKYHLNGNNLTGNGVHTHNYQLAYFWAAHPHHNEYKCSCGASYVDKNSVNYYGNCNTCKSRVINDGWYRIALASDTNYVVDVYGSSKENGSNVHLYKYVGGNNQKVYFKYIGDGYYTIKFKHSGKMLDVYNGNKASGTNVWQYQSNNTDAQKWALLSAGNGAYYLKSKLGSFFLDNPNNNIKNENSIWIYNQNYSNAQKWKLIEVEHSLNTKNAKISTYFSEGYTGNKVCKTCGKTISKGKTIAKKAPTVKYKAGNSKIKVAYKHVSGANGFQVVLKRGGKKYIKTFYTTNSVSKYISAKKGTYRVYTRAFNNQLRVLNIVLGQKYNI